MNPERTPPTIEASDAARALAARRQIRTKTCPICGTEFQTAGRGLYDKEECRYRATYLRKKDARTHARIKRLEAKAAAKGS